MKIASTVALPDAATSITPTILLFARLRLSPAGSSFNNLLPESTISGILSVMSLPFYDKLIATVPVRDVIFNRPPAVSGILVEPSRVPTISSDTAGPADPNKFAVSVN